MQDADPNGFLACWGGVIDCGAINACTTWRFDRLVGGVVANRTAMAPLQVLDNDTFTPIHRSSQSLCSHWNEVPLGRSPSGSGAKKEPWVQAIGVLQLRNEAGEHF